MDLNECGPSDVAAETGGTIGLQPFRELMLRATLILLDSSRFALRLRRQKIRGDSESHAALTAMARSINWLWGYRVGDFRFICQIEGAALAVVAVRVAHRSQDCG